ncbi:MAG: TadE/TadG family type IV pilus assembly protein [Acetobacteraceae bacterium]
MPSGAGRGAGRSRTGRGGATLEFALLALPFFLLLFGIADAARYLLVQHGVRTLAAEATRAAMVQIMAGGSLWDRNGACATRSILASRVAASAPYLDLGRLTLCVTMAADTSVSPSATTLSINASYPFSFMLTAWGGNATISSTAGVTF